MFCSSQTEQGPSYTQLLRGSSCQIIPDLKRCYSSQKGEERNWRLFHEPFMDSFQTISAPISLTHLCHMAPINCEEARNHREANRMFSDHTFPDKMETAQSQVVKGPRFWLYLCQSQRTGAWASHCLPGPRTGSPEKMSHSLSCFCFFFKATFPGKYVYIFTSNNKAGKNKFSSLAHLPSCPLRQLRHLC